jgi:hypothetical protein
MHGVPGNVNLLTTIFEPFVKFDGLKELSWEDSGIDNDGMQDRARGFALEPHPVGIMRSDLPRRDLVVPHLIPRCDRRRASLQRAFLRTLYEITRENHIIIDKCHVRASCYFQTGIPIGAEALMRALLVQNPSKLAHNRHGAVGIPIVANDDLVGNPRSRRNALERSAKIRWSVHRADAQG